MKATLHLLIDSPQPRSFPRCRPRRTRDASPHMTGRRRRPQGCPAPPAGLRAAAGPLRHPRGSAAPRTAPTCTAPAPAPSPPGRACAPRAAAATGGAARARGNGRVAAVGAPLPDRTGRLLPHDGEAGAASLFSVVLTKA